MRTTSLLLSLAALAGVAILLLRDEGNSPRDDGLRAMDARIDAVEGQLAALTQDVRTLLEERRDAGPKLLTASSSEQAAIERLNRRAAALEDTLTQLRAIVMQQGRAVAPIPKKPVAKKRRADPDAVDRWLEKLEHESNDIVFAATIELGRAGDLRATDPLIRVLESHQDFYARLGAATALGELQAPDAVDALIESLNEKDELVRTASADALKRITGKDLGYVSGLAEKRRQAIQDDYRDWWREHGDTVAARLQELKDSKKKR